MQKTTLISRLLNVNIVNDAKKDIYLKEQITIGMLLMNILINLQ